MKHLVIILAVLGSVAVTGAADWPQWRGPFLNGSTSETNLPSRWEAQDVKWKAALPGKSGATPIVSGDSVFVVSPNAEKDLLLFCLDRASGGVRWKVTAGTGNRENGKNNMAACSPVTDGTNVYALFGTGDFIACDRSGKEVWRRNLTRDYGTFSVLFLYGASPLLYESKLYIQLLQRNPPVYGHAKDAKAERQSLLICIDPTTGSTVWQVERKTDAPEEAMEAYTTVVPSFTSSETELILVGADAVTAHRPSDGKELWRFSGLNLRKNPGGRIVPSPTTAPGCIFVCGPKREMLVALRPETSEGSGPGRILWKTATNVPDVCTPLYYEGKLFVLDGDRQVITCYKPLSGERIWQGKLGVREIFYASPTGADGKVYCFSEEGTVVVLSAGEKFETLGTMPLGEGPSNSSVVAAHGQLFIRTARNLYCIGRATK